MFEKKKTMSSEELGKLLDEAREVDQARKYLGPKYDSVSDEEVVKIAKEEKLFYLTEDINKSKGKHKYLKDEKASGGSVKKKYAYGGRVAKYKE